MAKQNGKLVNKNLQRSSFASTGWSISSSTYSTATWYHNLSVDVLVNIFKSFREEELRNINLVCKRWSYATKQPELWKKLQIYGKDVPTLYICRKIRDLKHLESIHLDNVAEPITILRQVCRCAPNIKHLAIRNSPAIPEPALRNLIQCCKKLESLDLSGTEFKANRFYEEIAGLMKLRSVNFSKNSSLSVRNLLTVVLNCRKLEELKLSTFSPSKPPELLSDEDASFMLWNLADTLKALTLDTSTLSNFSFKAILNCNKLEKLGLYGAVNLSPELFTNIWKNLPCLKMLKVRHAHHITGQNVSELFVSGKEVMQNVVSIDFTGCWKITDIGIEAIANCCCNLHSLTLKNCKRVCSLQPIRDKCTKLQELNMAFCVNLDVQTILPLPQSIKVLIVDRSSKFFDFTQNATYKKPNVRVKICLSEYNTAMENVNK